MVSNLTQNKLVRLLKALAKGEQEIEQERQTLVRNPLFESYTAFKRLDRYSTNALSANEIVTFLKEKKIFVTEKEIKCLFNTYSANCGLRIVYNDFQKLVLPRTNDRLRFKCLGRPVEPITKDEYLHEDVEKALAKFIKKEIDFLREVEVFKEDLSIRMDFGLMDAFTLIDKQKKGTLDFKALYSFLETKMTVYEDDIGALLARFDKNRDQVLSYTEFAEILQPVNPNYKLALKSLSPQRSPRASSPEQKELVEEKVYTPAKEKRVTIADDYKSSLNETATTENQMRTSRFTKSNSYTDSPGFRSSLKKDGVFSKSPSPGRVNRLSQVSTIKSDSMYSPSPFEATESRISRGKSPRESSPVREAYELIEGFKGIERSEKKSLARFLKEELELEKGLERIKRDLSLQRKFNSFSLFRVFDIGVKGYITRNELEDGLKELNIYPSKNELSLLMRRFDRHGDGIIKYSNFKQEIEPKDGENRSSSELKDGDLDYEVRGVMRKLFNKMISSENTCEELRRSLRRQLRDTISDVFLNLQKSNTNPVTASVLKDFLTTEIMYTNTDDAKLLLTRFDRNNIGRISYGEFIEGLLQRLP